MSDEELHQYVKKLQELLYQSIRELAYVQEVENCRSGLCASSQGKDLVDKGMELLKLKDLSAESLYPRRGSWE